MRTALLAALLATGLLSSTRAEEDPPRLPDWLRPIPGSQVGEPYRVVVNGEASVFVNAAVARGLAQVLEHYRGTCRGRSLLADLPAEEQQARGLVDGISVQEAPGWAMLGFVDREGHTAGVVLFSDPDPKVKRTQYYLSWSEARSEVPQLDPGRDAPGRDPPDVPRPPGLRRAFSMERSAPEPSSTHLYEGEGDPARLAADLRTGMAERGWQEDPAVAGEFPAGNLQLYARDDRMCQVMVAQEEGGRVRVTVMVTPR